MQFTKLLPNSNLRSSSRAVPVFDLLSAHFPSCSLVLSAWPRNVRLPGGPPRSIESLSGSAPWVSFVLRLPRLHGMNHKFCCVKWKGGAFRLQTLWNPLWEEEIPKGHMDPYPRRLPGRLPVPAGRRGRCPDHLRLFAGSCSPSNHV